MRGTPNLSSESGAGIMSGWKARIGYLSPSVFETPSDWDLILPKGFTIVASGLNVQAHTDAEFNKAIDALSSGLEIFAAEECDAILMGGITLGTQRGYGTEQEIVAKLSRQIGLPISTAMSATVEALKFLQVRTTVIATAYKKSINQAVKKYYEDGGLTVADIEGLEVSNQWIKLSCRSTHHTRWRAICFSATRPSTAC
jgi:maleate cis-trans isomerase